MKLKDTVALTGESDAKELENIFEFPIDDFGCIPVDAEKNGIVPEEP